MESRKTVGSSSSSISSELFGVKDSRKLKSSGIFESVFASPSEMMGRNDSHSGSYGSWRNNEEGNETWNSKHAYGDHSYISDRSSVYGDENQNGRSKERSSIDVDEPSDKSTFISAVYYGGRDTWSIPNSPSSVSSHNVMGRNVSHSGNYESRRNEEEDNETWKSKHPCAGFGDQSQNDSNKERNSIDVDELSPDKSAFISAVYYGGRDTWSIPSSPSSGSPHNFKRNDGKYDTNTSDSNSVSGGNWWEGSLYY